MTKITDGAIDREVGQSDIERMSLRGGKNFPIRHAKVIRVDPKRMVVDLASLSGPKLQQVNVPITFPGAGSRHFLGALPEVGDICLVGQAPAESGRSKRFVVLGWFVPSTQAGYDWLSVRSHSPDELNLDPRNEVYLQGLASQRRHKLRQMEAGNVVASSSQGSDLLLSESATLTNRRGNEIILRDQDQALVVRSLQQFHAGAGFRSYSGMIQRDSTLLPTQMAEDLSDWDSTRQVDEEGLPLDESELDPSDDPGGLRLPEALDSFVIPSNLSPRSVLSRGLFLDPNGGAVSVGGGATYGGKPMYRVCRDLASNGVASPNEEVFTEYRIEVAHTTDGTLPVTEQTEGIDIDRLPPGTRPSATGQVGGDTDPNDLSRKSSNEPMVEFVLGTAVGNNPFTDPASYGQPLVAKIVDEEGKPATKIRPYDPSKGDTISDQLAFLVRSRDPTDPTRTSFIALSKGGAWLTDFQGQGSAVAQENLRTGRRAFLGTDPEGHSSTIVADGTIAMYSESGRPADNVGVEIGSNSGAVQIFGGGTNTSGIVGNMSNALQETALKLSSAKSTLIDAVDTIRTTGNEIAGKAKVFIMEADNSYNITTGDSLSMSTKSFEVTASGGANYSFGGPKNGLFTNGPSRTVSFSSSPATGGVPGNVDEYKMLFGGRDSTFRFGYDITEVNVGGVEARIGASINFLAVLPKMEAKVGVQGLDNGFSATPLFSSLSSTFGNTRVKAKSGKVEVSGTAGVTIRGASVKIQAPRVTVLALGKPGRVLTDMCRDPLSGRPFAFTGTVGTSGFGVGF